MFPLGHEGRRFAKTGLFTAMPAATFSAYKRCKKTNTTIKSIGFLSNFASVLLNK